MYANNNYEEIKEQNKDNFENNQMMNKEELSMKEYNKRLNFISNKFAKEDLKYIKNQMIDNDEYDDCIIDVDEGYFT